jgi:hypothetical protein
MSADVEILASTALDAGDLSEIEDQVRQWGLGTRTSRMPPRRGAAELSWLLLMTIPAEVVAKSMLEKLGTELYQGLRGIVQRVLRNHHRTAPGGVVVESATTGAQFALEADLPVEAYRQLFDEIAAGTAADGVRTFDRDHQRWSLAAAV